MAKDNGGILRSDTTPRSLAGLEPATCPACGLERTRPHARRCPRCNYEFVDAGGCRNCGR